MTTPCVFVPFLSLRRRERRRFDYNLGLPYLAILSMLCAPGSGVALAHEIQNGSSKTETTVETNISAETKPVVTKSSVKEPVASEIATSGMISYGNYKVFGAAPRATIWSVGLEYDRHSWGYFLKAQVDWVAEVLPIAILSEPASADFWGNPTSPDQQIVPGLGISPCCFRFLWRSNAKVKPFMTSKVGVIVFPKKILSADSSYANFNFQGDFGVQIRMNDRVELRLEPLVYFHVSNGYLAKSNPGFDQLGGKFGISYHLGKPAPR